MSETNIADAISTFSEIGIVAGLAWLLEVLPMQKDLEASLLIAIESQQVTQAHYREKAKEFGRLTELALCLWLFIEYYSFKLLIILLYRIQRAFPFICVALGV